MKVYLNQSSYFPNSCPPRHTHTNTLIHPLILLDLLAGWSQQPGLCPELNMTSWSKLSKRSSMHKSCYRLGFQQPSGRRLPEWEAPVHSKARQDFILWMTALTSCFHHFWLPTSLLFFMCRMETHSFKASQVPSSSGKASSSWDSWCPLCILVKSLHM